MPCDEEGQDWTGQGTPQSASKSPEAKEWGTEKIFSCLDLRGNQAVYISVWNSSSSPLRRHTSVIKAASVWWFVTAALRNEHIYLARHSVFFSRSRIAAWPIREGWALPEPGGKGTGTHWCVRNLGEEVQGTTRLLVSMFLLQGLTNLDSSLLELDQLLFCAEATLLYRRSDPWLAQWDLNFNITFLCSSSIRSFIAYTGKFLDWKVRFLLLISHFSSGT